MTYRYTDGGTHSGFNVRKENGSTVGIAHDLQHAQLFAAAPDLLAALEEARKWADDAGYGAGRICMAHWYEAAVAAIAKARGQS